MELEGWQKWLLYAAGAVFLAVAAWQCAEDGPGCVNTEANPDRCEEGDTYGF
ncbi:MAG: hypothetical protein ACR2HN_06430 [Tepidiformaceae bacterium]